MDPDAWIDASVDQCIQSAALGGRRDDGCPRGEAAAIGERPRITESIPTARRARHGDAARVEADLPGMGAGGCAALPAQQPRPGGGRAARMTWSCTAARARRRGTGSALEAIVAALRELDRTETLIVQSGKPVAVVPTHPDAPRVLISSAMLVPAWSTPEDFWALEAAGLTMYGQMTAGGLVLHRHPGHPRLHLRDVQRGRQGALRRHAGREARADRRAWRHGRRAGHGRQPQRRAGAGDRGRSPAGPAPRRRAAGSIW